MDPILKKGPFFRNTFLRCLTRALCLIQVVWCIGLAGGSRFAIIYFEIRLSCKTLLFHRMFSKFLPVVVLSHDWPDNALLVLSQECSWFRPILSLMNDVQAQCGVVVRSNQTLASSQKATSATKSWSKHFATSCLDDALQARGWGRKQTRSTPSASG